MVGTTQPSLIFISRWKRANPSNTAKKIEDIKTQLEQAQLDDNFSNEAILNLKWNLCAAFRDEELYRKQKTAESTKPSFEATQIKRLRGGYGRRHGASGNMLFSDVVHFVKSLRFR
ncbi:hypothetical protein Bca52824_041287 [Brassica carinata]|uniref:Uncharacterized protein n=1 Tax=Brassica carinata TaxID=52824 RepID=A0A8X7RWB5_BRACI|nr:hypothetical protein Bca52824_041287 [Brassica carinata]